MEEVRKELEEENKNDKCCQLINVASNMPYAGVYRLMTDDTNQQIMIDGHVQYVQQNAVENQFAITFGRKSQYGTGWYIANHEGGFCWKLKGLTDLVI